MKRAQAGVVMVSRSIDVVKMEKMGREANEEIYYTGETQTVTKKSKMMLK